MTETVDTRPRVLIMEDEFVVGLDMVEQAKVIGLAVDGPYATLAEGTRAADAQAPDLAILDIQLRDGAVFPLAERLAQDGVPIIFHSGHTDETDLHERFPQAQVCAKPCPPNIILDLLAGTRCAA